MMTEAPPPPPVKLPRLNEQQIQRALGNCPRLPSLSSINNALRELLHADQRYTSQIAEVIRRDPSLTARLLRLVNSVYYGITSPVNSIEEAVFYLGVRQIRQLAMVTPVIEDFQKLAGNRPFQWKGFWQHCIGTAVLTREITGMLQAPVEEIDYVCGLIHDVGKIAMSAAFPAYFDAIYCDRNATGEDLIAREMEILGIDHCELGALYLKRHNLPEALVETARFHHQPERASHHTRYVAAVQIADLVVRFAGIGNSGNTGEVLEGDWINASGWSILFPSQAEAERKIAHASLKRSLERLPTILEGLL